MNGLYRDNRLVSAIDAIPLSADGSYVLEMPIPSSFSLQATWIGADATDATITAYVSNDGTNYVAYAGLSAITLNAASGTLFLRLAPPAQTIERYVKFVVSHGTNSAGSVELLINVYKRS